MGIFEGLKHAKTKTSDRGVWLNPGVYRVKVAKCIWKQTRSKGEAFIMEMDILKSTYNPQQHVVDGRKIAEAPNEAGTRATWYQSCRDRDVGFGALKGFAADITGAKVEDPVFVSAVEGLLEQFLEGAIDGVELNVEVLKVKTKAGTDFSLHRFKKAA